MKKRCEHRFVSLLVLIAALATCPICTRAALIAHWSFDSQVGGVFPDSTSNHDATVKTNGSGAASAAAGVFGDAIQFNNASGTQATNNVYLEIPNLTEIMGAAGGSYTVAAWVKSANTSSNNPILADWGTAPAGENRFSYWFSLNNSSSRGNPRAHTRSGSGNGVDIFARQIGWNAANNQWHHVAWSWDKALRTLTTYFDGWPIDTFTVGPAVNPDVLESSSPVGSIGRKADSDNYFVGALDEIWVVGDALSQPQIENLRDFNSLHAPHSWIRVPVTNYSFETPAQTIGTSENGTTNNFGPGWTMALETGSSSNHGVVNPASAHYATVTGSPLPASFHANQIAFINLNTDGTVARADSTIVGQLLENATYTLAVAVGGRNTASWRDVLYSIGLVTADGTELGTFAEWQIDPGASATNIHDLVYTLDVNSQALAHVGEDIFVRIRATNTGAGGTGEFTQANFDFIRLSAFVIPEPTGALLAWKALCILTIFGRRRTAHRAAETVNLRLWLPREIRCCGVTSL